MQPGCTGKNQHATQVFQSRRKEAPLEAMRSANDGSEIFIKPDIRMLDGRKLCVRNIHKGRREHGAAPQRI